MRKNHLIGIGAAIVALLAMGAGTASAGLYAVTPAKIQVWGAQGLVRTITCTTTTTAPGCDYRGVPTVNGIPVGNAVAVFRAYYHNDTDEAGYRLVDGRGNYYQSASSPAVKRVMDLADASGGPGAARAEEDGDYMFGTNRAHAAGKRKGHGHRVVHHRLGASKHVHTVDAVIRRKLRVFRARGAAFAASMPAGLAEAFTDEQTPGTGANLELAKEVDTPTGPVYIVPGRGTICLAGTGGGACGPDNLLGQDPRAYVMFGRYQGVPQGDIGVAGIVADDVVRIDAVLADGTTRIPVPFSGNAFSAYIPADASKLEYHTTDHGIVVGNVAHEPAGPTPAPPTR
jgi:hypothetical protein